MRFVVWGILAAAAMSGTGCNAILGNADHAYDPELGDSATPDGFAREATARSDASNRPDARAPEDATRPTHDDAHDASPEADAHDGDAATPDVGRPDVTSLDSGVADVAAQDSTAPAESGTGCTFGTTQCVGTGVATCQQDGTYSTPEPCPYSLCAVNVEGNGACTGQCTPLTVQCSGQQPQSCNAAGQWVNEGSACSDQTCVAGLCQGACAPEQTGCSGAIPQTCDMNGNWVNQTACTDVCLNGVCTGNCAPNATECGSSNNVLTCSSTGSWPTSGGTACTPLGKTCLQTGSTATCAGACSVGALQCSGQQPQKCSSVGAWTNNGSACSNSTCSAGACVGQCAPGETDTSGCAQGSCNGQDGNAASTRTCSTTGGVWGSCSGAISSTSCTNVATVDGVSASCGGGVQCPGGSCSAPTPTSCTDVHGCGGYTCNGSCTPLGGLSGWSSSTLITPSGLLDNVTPVCESPQPYITIKQPPVTTPEVITITVQAVATGGSCSSSGSSIIAAVGCSPDSTVPCFGNTAYNDVLTFTSSEMGTGATKSIACQPSATSNATKVLIYKTSTASGSGCAQEFEIIAETATAGACTVPP